MKDTLFEKTNFDQIIIKYYDNGLISSKIDREITSDSDTIIIEKEEYFHDTIKFNNKTFIKDSLCWSLYEPEFKYLESSYMLVDENGYLIYEYNFHGGTDSLYAVFEYEYDSKGRIKQLKLKYNRNDTLQITHRKNFTYNKNGTERLVVSYDYDHLENEYIKS